MKIFIITIALILFLVLVLFLYSACVISSRCSREEERWQQQEYGKLPKD